LYCENCGRDWKLLFAPIDAGIAKSRYNGGPGVILASVIERLGRFGESIVIVNASTRKHALPVDIVGDSFVPVSLKNTYAEVRGYRAESSGSRRHPQFECR
jgi:hypothetical protein